ncbi:NADP-dependent oxidoreductase [Bowmanella sp. JS7-9]|uniref:NADP-dependent oxidoreductase n=1 Tax=Alteromonadaceae TaxID=72275 RepID=UPI00103C7C06|nr:NADP-dependent oxidoreductase [Bowmanella sp. JS7-9]TBX21391.1 NADP-dependent oxidoreductase [Bowmanella sp. JS7-9]
MTDYTRILLTARPDKRGIGDYLFTRERVAIPSPAEGEILVKQTHMSLDPAMLGWMSPDTESYIPPVQLGEVMRSSGAGEVVESNHPNFNVGDRVMGMMGWTEYAVSNGKGLNKIQDSISTEMALCIFALPGLTATQGYLNVGKPKAGETLVVTGAAGSVGSIVGQMAKADGLRVIGVVGSDEKAKWIVEELGFDGAINYKSDDLADKLAALTPDKIDIFFENTGGPIQQLIYQRMNTHGRIVVCGMIADYLSATPAPGPNWINMIKKRLTIQGFAMPDHFHEVPKLLGQLTPYVMQGKIKYRAHTIEGLDQAVNGLQMLFNGDNQGKMLVKL